MTTTITNSCKEYEKFVKEFYPRSVFSCSHHRKLIGNLFSVIEIIDVYIDTLNKSNFSDSLAHIKHQFLLMLYHLPNYNTFFISALQRSISETALRMALVSIGHSVKESNNMQFFRIQETLKKEDLYINNQGKFKDSCDALFSYFGTYSKIMHNSTSNRQNFLQYIEAFNTTLTDQQVEKMTKFIKVIEEYILVNFSYINNINDYTLNLASKIQFKKIIGAELYNHYFCVE